MQGKAPKGLLDGKAAPTLEKVLPVARSHSRGGPGH